MTTIRYLILGIVLLLLVGSVSAEILVVSMDWDDDAYRQVSAGSTFVGLRDGVGTHHGAPPTATVGVYTGIGTNNYTSIRRYFLNANTSALNASTVNSAYISLYGTVKTEGTGTPTLELVKTDATTTNLTTNYPLVYNTTIGNMTYAAFSTTAYNNISITDLTAINNTGITQLGARVSWDLFNHTTGISWSNSTSSRFVFNASLAEANTPILTIDYTPAMASFTHNITQSYNSTYGKYVDNSYIFQFNDSSPSTPTAWNWSYTNVTGNNTETFFGTTKNITQALGIGNWSIQLNVTTPHYINKTPANTYFINISWGYPDIINLTGITLFPADHVLNVPINNLSVDSRSSTYISHWVSLGTTFAYYKGLPWNVVDSKTPHKTIDICSALILTDCFYAPYSTDPGPYPIPDYPRIQGGYNVVSAGSDHHLLIVDRDDNYLYELYQPTRDTEPPDPFDTSYRIHSGAIWDLSGYALTPIGHSTTSAAGLPILPLIVKYDEVATGTVSHVATFTIKHVNYSYIWPARQKGSSLWTNGTAPPYGQRFRLKSTYDISAFPTQSKVIAQGLKTYGMILSDAGTSTTASLRMDVNVNWNSTDLASLYTIPISEFEAIDESGLMIDIDSGQADMSYYSPISGFYSNVTTGPSPLDVQFNDTSTGTPTDWDWYWSADETKDSDLQNPTTTFTDGTYNVRLYAANAYGGTWHNHTGYITSTPTVAADFMGYPTSGYSPLTVQFYDNSTSASMWAWDFTNDGSTDSTSQNPSYIYTTGTYTVKMTASNAYGSDWETKVLYIWVTAPPPVSDFWGTPTYGTVPFTVTFTDTSSNTPTSWAWNFGDGGTSVLQNPTYSYTTGGTYTVSLNATNAAGSDTETKVSYVVANVIAPSPTPTVTPTPTPSPTPVVPSGSGPQIQSCYITTSNSVNVTITDIYGDTVWIVYGQNEGGYTWITQNYTATAGGATVQVSGSPLFGNTHYHSKACDASGCGNDCQFSTVQITPMPTTTFGWGFKNIVGMR